MRVKTDRTILIRVILALIGLLLIIWCTLETMRIERLRETKIDPRATIVARGFMLLQTINDLTDVISHVLHPR